MRRLRQKQEDAPEDHWDRRLDLAEGRAGWVDTSAGFTYADKVSDSDHLLRIARGL